MAIQKKIDISAVLDNQPISLSAGNSGSLFFWASLYWVSTALMSHQSVLLHQP
ncbi:hypothetical protein [Phytobacter sp. AG2a]